MVNVYCIGIESSYFQYDTSDRVDGIDGPNLEYTTDAEGRNAAAAAAAMAEASYRNVNGAAPVLAHDNLARC